MTKRLPGDQLRKKNHDAFGSGVGNKCCHSASGNLQQQSCNSGSGIAERLLRSACCGALAAEHLLRSACCGALAVERLLRS